MEFQFLGAPGIKSRLSFWSTESESMREVILGSGWQYRVAAAATVVVSVQCRASPTPRGGGQKTEGRSKSDGWGGFVIPLSVGRAGGCVRL